MIRADKFEKICYLYEKMIYTVSQYSEILNDPAIRILKENREELTNAINQYKFSNDQKKVLIKYCSKIDECINQRMV